MTDNSRLIQEQMQYAGMLMKSGQFEAALVKHNKVLELDPRNEMALTGKGYSLVQVALKNGLGPQFNSRLSEAVLCYDKAIQISPNHGYLWAFKGTALVYLTKFNEANECYDNALRLEPGDPETTFNKANCLYVMGRLQEALKYYEMAHSLGHSSAIEKINEVKQELRRQ